MTVQLLAEHHLEFLSLKRGCTGKRVRKQPIIALYFESEPELKFYNLEACNLHTIDNQYAKL